MHPSAKTPSPTVDTSLSEVIVQPSLEESIPLETQSLEATAQPTLEENNLLEVFSFLSLSLEPSNH